MIAFAVMSESGQVLAIFRETKDAQRFKDENANRRGAVFKAVSIVENLYAEEIWQPSFRPIGKPSPKDPIQ